MSLPVCPECYERPVSAEGAECCGRCAPKLARRRAAMPRTPVTVDLEVEGAPLTADELRHIEAALDEALRGRWLVLSGDARRRVATVHVRKTGGGP
jgi:hypothetical protein